MSRDFTDILVLASRHLDPAQLAKVAPWPLPEVLPYQPEFGYGHHCLTCTGAAHGARPYSVAKIVALVAAVVALVAGIVAAFALAGPA